MERRAAFVAVLGICRIGVGTEEALRIEHGTISERLDAQYQYCGPEA
jgi:hypothetical protein